MKINKKSVRLLLLGVLFWFSSSTQAFDVSNNIGAGIGIPYGLFGVNYELELNIVDSFAVGPSIGLGSTIVAGTAAQYGVKMHFLDRRSLVRIGLSYWNAVNTVVKTGSESWEAKRGNVVAADIRFQFGRKRNNGLDIYVLKILSPTKSDLEDEGYNVTSYGSPIKFGIGYVHRF